MVRLPKDITMAFWVAALLALILACQWAPAAQLLSDDQLQVLHGRITHAFERCGTNETGCPLPCSPVPPLGYPYWILVGLSHDACVPTAWCISCANDTPQPCAGSLWYYDPECDHLIGPGQGAAEEPGCGSDEPFKCDQGGGA